MRLRSLIAVLYMFIATLALADDTPAKITPSPNPVPVNYEDKKCKDCGDGGWVVAVAPQVGYVTYNNRLLYPDQRPFRVKESGADYAGPLYGVSAEVGHGVRFGGALLQVSHLRGKLDLTSFMTRDLNGRILFDEDVVEDAKYDETHVNGLICLRNHFLVGVGRSWINVFTDSVTTSLNIETHIELDTSYTGNFLLVGAGSASKRMAYWGQFRWYPTVNRTDVSTFTTSRSFTQDDSTKGKGWSAHAVGSYRLNRWMYLQPNLFYRKFSFPDTPFLSSDEDGIHIAERTKWFGASVAFAIPITF